MRTMKAAVVHAFREPLSIEEVPVPEVRAGEILVKLAACGVCHTDLHAADGDWPVRPRLPFIPGHEGVGTVAAVGAGIKHVREGDRVGVPWLHTACGHCEHCLTGWETLCDHQQMTGYSVNGGFAEYVLADPDYVGHLPAEGSFEALAPILCAGLTVYKGLKVLEARPGQWVAIVGAGGLGHLAIQYARAMGFHVAAVDVDATKLGLAAALGAELCVNAADDDPAAVLQRELHGVHGALVTAVSRQSFSQSLAMLRKRGTMSMVGLPPGDFGLPIFDVVLNAKTVRGSIVGTRQDLNEALQFAAEKKVHAETTPHALEDVNVIFDALRRGRIEGRAVLTFD
ncbi:zinc-dependent alcohol dehydrogenase [Roseateles sp. MS654]|uniref:zinc-dependent alcohol dehydrogenase n=1 Tax=Roseateles sp. MS654 TaxID=3412685 RepID=UPI003C30D3D1